MVPKNRKNYPIIVRFLHQAAEKSNLNIVHVVDREKDGARIFFFYFVYSAFTYFIFRAKKVSFSYFQQIKISTCCPIGRKITITNLCDREEFEKLVGQL